MVFDTTYNNISIIIWRSLLLVEETAVTGKPNELPQVTDKTLSRDEQPNRSTFLIPISMVVKSEILHIAQNVHTARHRNDGSCN
jgi:hypothetical protein